MTVITIGMTCCRNGYLLLRAADGAGFTRQALCLARRLGDHHAALGIINMAAGRYLHLNVFAAVCACACGNTGNRAVWLCNNGVILCIFYIMPQRGDLIRC